MKVLHLGAAHPAALPFLRSPGDAVHVISPDIGVPDPLPSRFILHVHSSSALRALFAAESEMLRDALRNRGAVVYSAYGAPDEPGVAPLLREIDHLFVSSPSASPLTAHTPSWSWQSQPVWLPPEVTVGVAPKPQEVRVLFVRGAGRPENDDAVTAAVERLRSRAAFEFSTVSLPDLGWPGVEEALDRCDVLIETAVEPCWGMLALSALARGKTVLSGNSPSLHAAWPQIATSPVLHVDAQLLERRLDGVVCEPRCLRDLSRRSRAWMEAQHDGEKIVPQLNEFYRKILAGKASVGAPASR